MTRLEFGDWASFSAEAYAIRHTVFVQEQGVPEELEQDEFDPQSLHALVRDADGKAIATGRLLPDGHIGRLSVLASWRGKGVGRQLILGLLAQAYKRGHGSVELNAQCSAQGFYESMGFEVVGPVFMEAGIPHQAMRKSLS
ncbi:GNAT family N-acetyltransferase [Viridibacterium curvum]|uniref:GNAT family N-acetyltransferase n=1 Tax=Viridibacterium curvum TaxID=1101404 RepID=A0ABP9Q9Q5_9RHOO